MSNVIRRPRSVCGRAKQFGRMSVAKHDALCEVRWHRRASWFLGVLSVASVANAFDRAAAFGRVPSRQQGDTVITAIGYKPSCGLRLGHWLHEERAGCRTRPFPAY